jgi:hypothetical protein
MYTTEPGPLPEPPDVTVIQAAPGSAVYAHPAGVVTSTARLSPLAGTLASYGLRLTVQSAPA